MPNKRIGKPLTAVQQRIRQLEAEARQLRLDNDFLTNRLLNKRPPYAKNQFAFTRDWRATTSRLLFGG
jgi:hypothetical protein